MIKKLKLRESNGDKISEVIRSEAVRNKLNEVRDNFFEQGTYSMDGKDYEIKDVKCTIGDVYDVLGNPGIYDIICYADIKWNYDEDTDTVGTREMFSFYYDPETDTIFEDENINVLEESFSDEDIKEQLRTIVMRAKNILSDVYMIKDKIYQEDYLRNLKEHLDVIDESLSEISLNSSRAWQHDKNGRKVNF